MVVVLYGCSEGAHPEAASDNSQMDTATAMETPAAPQDADSTRSISPAADSVSAMYRTTLQHRPGGNKISDTFHAPTQIIRDTAKSITPKNAVLGFSYFPQIPLNESRDLRVFVKVRGEAKKVKQKLRDIEQQDMEFTKRDDSSIVCIINNIQAYRKLSIKPLYDSSDFQLTRIDEENSETAGDGNEQVLDFDNGNYWHWKVKAISPTPHVGNITLRIKAETPEGQKIQLAERQIDIKIGIDPPKKTVGEKAYSFFDTHFKDILTIVIVPLAGLLFAMLRKWYKKRKSKNKQSENDGDKQ